MSLVLSNLVVVLVLCFYKLNTRNPWRWEDVGYRTGFVSVAQLPLIVLLAGRENIIGFLTGVGYERLNWLHRWTARTLWLSATIHMGFWFRSWARYDYILIKLKTDPITQRGFASWCILTFIVLTSISPLRRLSYELFVISHLVTFAGFIAAVWLHVPSENKIWVWLPIAFFAVDRILRAGWFLHHNLPPFRSSKNRNDRGWGHGASLTRLPGDVTKITIENPGFWWQPGQHFFLSCHSIIPFQSHPFTISSLPSDRKLEFLVKAQSGGTKTFFHHATKHDTLLVPALDTRSALRRVGLEGPYGRMRSLDQFDSVVLFAGSTGATFTVPHMRYIVNSWRNDAESALARKIRFVWVVKSRSQFMWFSHQLEKVVEDTNSHMKSNTGADVQVEISVYVTCDEELVSEKNSSASCCQPVSYGSQSPTELPNGINEKGGDKTSDSKESTYSYNEVVAAKGCCCCRATVEDESAPQICTCSQIEPANVSSLSSTSKSEKDGLTISDTDTDTDTKPKSKATLKLLSGRPHVRGIIRKVLEEAEGESAVVVCGPHGLHDDVRSSVVSLSDERAVHKGTGAQGVYFHAEGFCY